MWKITEKDKKIKIDDNYLWNYGSALKSFTLSLKFLSESDLAKF